MTVLIIDGNPLIWRAAFSLGTDDYGIVYGVFKFFKEIAEKVDFDDVIFCWDSGGSRWRKEVLPEYKSSRKKDDIDLEEVYRQSRTARKLLSAQGVSQVQVTGVEADDLISWLSEWISEHLRRRVIVSTADHDLWQLINDKIYIFDSLRKELLGPQSVVEILEVYPHQIADMKAITGDSSDDVPGIKGIGDKIAAKLLREYDNIGKLYDLENKKSLSSKKKTAKLLETEQVSSSYRLVKSPTLRELPYILNQQEKQELRESLIFPKRDVNESRILRSRVGQLPRVEQDLRTFDLSGFSEFVMDTPETLYTWDTLDSEISACSRYELRNHCAEFGPTLAKGYSDAEIMVVGRNPGIEELTRGHPFVGKAGKRLDKFLDQIGMTRRECWITNVCKCYSMDNRPPTQGEVLACSQFLKSEIELVQPKFIITFGNEAMMCLTPYSSQVTRYCGEILKHPESSILGIQVPAWVAISVHPSMALRSSKGEAHLEFAAEKVKEFLDQRR